MNNTRVLFILFILLGTLEDEAIRPSNVPKKNEQNEQNEQNPGVVHFCPPPKSTKRTK